MRTFRSNRALLTSMLLASTLLPGTANAAPHEAHRAPSLERQVLSMTNSARRWVGCPPLHLAPALNRAARAHSIEMAEEGYFDHISPDGSDPGGRALDAGYPSNFVAENIAAGNGLAGRTFRQWMNSSGHRRNILDCTYTDLGVGHAFRPDSRYGHYWVQELGNPHLTSR
ncbi:CAP domain-containing protein [Parasphingorhabdus pacifica]